MSEHQAAKAQQKANIERRIRSLRERRERQRLNLANLQATYELLGAEIASAEEELARAG